MEAPSSPSSTITAPPDYRETSQRLAKLIVEAMTCGFAFLHYDSTSRSMIEWCWPLDTDGEKIPPSGLERYRDKYEFRYPCCLCADERERGAYTEAAVYSWWDRSTNKVEWTARCTSDRCGYRATFRYPPRLRRMSLLHWDTTVLLIMMNYTEQRILPVEFEWNRREQTELLNRLACPDGYGITAKEFGSEFIDAYVGLITNQKVQTELYILSYLLKGRVYHGDLWELAGERSIEAKQEETLRRHQSICNGTGGSHVAVERYLIDERKKRCQLEVSLYSQAIEVLEQLRMPHVGLLAKHEIRTPYAAWRHSAPPLACLPLACAPLACSISTRETCETCSAQNGMYPNSHCHGSNPLESIPSPTAQQQRPASTILNYIGPSLPLLSTWVTADVQNAFYEAFHTELDMQSELMSKSLATRHSNAYLRNLGLDLLILHSKMRRAQAEIRLYMLAIDNTRLSDSSDLSSHSAWDETVETSLSPGEASPYDDLFDVDVEEPIDFDLDLDGCPDDSETCCLN
ncbi:hypothetical protein F4604DRAFT_1681201 [Suillus subluteus]|nr:hypothetical protein F4604DRAFT_1681201 [Suillus subluteus]